MSHSFGQHLMIVWCELGEDVGFRRADRNLRAIGTEEGGKHVVASFWLSRAPNNFHDNLRHIRKAGS
ncbi:hypothetical protein JDV02_002863 [Purpureocillium takamizusanense]|uniref:Uncharacterized protein n=1 Tax=Purpureocillium takamizusanense TaxID=2060973 RepID=A0A9Q8V992_9HYPO|nr:uncharacterized protein JDV02_002863 [Purpureocillium takamizusanense]UNI16431.1 hypothetical protein JDV02_002863 [Purpureocillium takamizusanense]